MTENLENKLTPFHMDVPETALRVIRVLETAGFETWVVGGCVRDAIMGRAYNDIDLATAALWTEVKAACESAGFRVRETGTQHGTVTVLVDLDPADAYVLEGSEDAEGAIMPAPDVYEVTTFRIDGPYLDGRHPKNVQFVRTVSDDLERRDFTMNALAYHPERGLLDLFGGLDDIKAGTIRAIGDPYHRFEEDGLRILRAARFSSQLGFTIEPDTYRAAVERRMILTHVSAERITEELSKLLLGDHVHDALMATSELLAWPLPEIVASVGYDQMTPYHKYDAWEHTAWVVQHSPATLRSRWAALLHDLGKPAAAFYDPEKGVRHFYGHAKISRAMAEGIFARLVLPKHIQNDVLILVSRHDDVIPSTPKGVKRMLAILDGRTDLFRMLCDLKHADALAHAPHKLERGQDADKLKELLIQVEAEGEAFNLHQLAVNGHDLLALGVRPGPQLGRQLNRLLDEVIDEITPNEREALLVRAQEMLSEG